MVPHSSMTFSPSQQLRRSPGTSCQISMPPYIRIESSGHYDSEQNCPAAFQQPVTRLGSSERVEPNRPCFRRVRKGRTGRDDVRAWESNRGCFHAEEEFNQHKESNRCRCNQKLGKYYDRRL